MIQLFERSSQDSNCLIGVNDAPFTIPLIIEDNIFLRLQVPYYLVIANGGGLPINANIKVLITDIDGTPLCDYGNGTIGRFLYSISNIPSLMIGEYRFMIPQRSNQFYSTIYWSLNVNDVIVVDYGGEIITWVYGKDNTPYPFIDYAQGRVCVRFNYVTTTVVFYVNGVVVSGTTLFVNETTECYNQSCFRVCIAITFGASIFYYYTKLYQLIKCKEESLYIESKYSSGDVDCGGHYNVSVSSPTIHSDKHYLRIIGGLERQPTKIVKTYNNRCFQYKSEMVRQDLLISEPMPDWYQDAVETVFMGTNFKINGKNYLLENSENIFEKNDIKGTTYQNINVSLSRCKIESVFKC